MADPHPSQDATLALTELANGQADAAERLLPLVYAELRGLAGHLFRQQPHEQTLQPTALVHEAYLRLIGQSDPNWRDRAHFMAVAAMAMRQILADHARRRSTAKRGGRWQRVTLDGLAGPAAEFDSGTLDAVLTELRALDERKYRVVELRFFAALSVEDVATVLGVSKTTVESDWRTARAWLSSRLSEPGH